MLALTSEKPVIGSIVGYRDNYSPGIDHFMSQDIGRVIECFPPNGNGQYSYEVIFNNKKDIYIDEQLILIKK